MSDKINVTKFEPRSPRSGELFRVQPGEDHRMAATVLIDVPEKGVVSDIGYHLIADHLSPTLWVDERVSPHLRRVTIYTCANLKNEFFLWAVDDRDEDSHALARTAETEWVARPIA
jgi:hypothetical protein